MLANFLFYFGLLISFGIGFLYFRDLGDVSQMLLKVKREHTIRFIRHEYKFLAIGIVFAILMITGYSLGGGTAWVFWPGLLVLAFLYIFPWVWVHL